MRMHCVRIYLVTLLAAVPLTASAQETEYVVTAGHWGSAQAAAVSAAGGTVVFDHAGAGVAVVRASAPDFAERLRASLVVDSVNVDRVVAWQQPSTMVDAADNAIDPGNDTFYPIQWAPKAIDAPAAWAAGCTGKGVRVAILDGGLFAAHPDLAANVDVARSKSFVPGQNFNQDTGTFWHGTHVAGIVAAVDNTRGVVGIAPEATLIGVKVLHSGSGSFGWIIQGILYAATPIEQGGAGADIINMSLGALFERDDPDAEGLVAAMNKAVNYVNRFGVLSVSAAGNDAVDLDHSGSFTVVPAQSGAGIAVSATAPVGFAYGAMNFDRLASYSNYGASAINVAAPGGDAVYPTNELCTMPVAGGTVTTACWVFDLVLSTSRGTTANGGYTWAAGTSMAAPAASAVAAIIKQQHPGISAGALKAALQQSATDSGKQGNDPFYGKGFVNALAACRQ
jgi:subtilisin family serine protease